MRSWDSMTKRERWGLLNVSVMTRKAKEMGAYKQNNTKPLHGNRRLNLKPNLHLSNFEIVTAAILLVDGLLGKFCDAFLEFVNLGHERVAILEKWKNIAIAFKWLFVMKSGFQKDRRNITRERAKWKKNAGESDFTGVIVEERNVHECHRAKILWE